MGNFNNPVNANQEGVQYLSNGAQWIGCDGVASNYVLTSNGTNVAPSFQSIQNAPYYSLTPLIVGSDSHSQYSTISAALAVATAGQYIFIKPGTYTENLTITVPVTLMAFGVLGQFIASGSVNIVGQISQSANATLGCYGIGLATTGGGHSLSVTNSANSIFQNCTFTPGTGTSLLLNNGGSNVTLENCEANLTNSGTLYTVTSGFLRIKNCSFTNGSTTSASTIAGTVSVINSVLNIPSTTSSTGSIVAYNTLFGGYFGTALNQTWITTAGTGTSYAKNCNFVSGTQSCASIGAGTTMIMVNTNLNSSNTNVLTGAGTLQYAILSFGGSSSGHNVSTETPFATLI